MSKQEIEMVVKSGEPEISAVGGRVMAWRLKCINWNDEEIEFVLHKEVPPRIGESVAITVEVQ